MGRPRRDERDTATTERILVAAEEAFAAHGFADARLEDIAAAAGVRRPSLLYHFPSKETLYRATVERVFARLREALAAAIAVQGTFEERADAMVRNYTSFIVRHPNLARLFVRELLQGGDAADRLLREQVAPLLDLAEAFVKEAGRGRLRENLDVRGAILQIVGGAVLFSIAGRLAPVIWADDPRGFSDQKRAERFARHVQDVVHTMLFAALPPRAKKTTKTATKKKRTKR